MRQRPKEQDKFERRHNFLPVEENLTAEQVKEEASRCLSCKNPRCVKGCPVNINIPEFIKALKEDNLEAAGAIVKAQMDEFFQWLDGRDIIPRIQEIRADAVEDLNLRIEKIFRKTPMEDSDREKLKKAVDTAAGKVVNKLIFGLRDSLNQDAFLECVEGLEKLYEE